MNELVVDLVLYLVPLILAITVHEFSHVAMAKWLGDDTGTRMGRFTLDPTKHIDPLWTIGLPATLMIVAHYSGGGIPVFAAGKPAPYNPMRLNRKFNGKRISLRTAELLVAIAGPVSNLILALLSLGVLFYLRSEGHYPEGPFAPVNLTARFFILNISLFIFNLIPVYPLDGSKVLTSILPREAAHKFEQISTQLSFALFGLLVFFGGSLLQGLVMFVVHLLRAPFF